MMQDPSKFAVAAVASPAAANEEPEEESDEDIGFGLFGDD
jgi:ribosomal protein L12E/L44/L45/RPP1/RPP2